MSTEQEVNKLNGLDEHGLDELMIMCKKSAYSVNSIQVKDCFFCSVNFSTINFMECISKFMGRKKKCGCYSKGECKCKTYSGLHMRDRIMGFKIGNLNEFPIILFSNLIDKIMVNFEPHIVKEDEALRYFKLRGNLMYKIIMISREWDDFSSTFNRFFLDFLLEFYKEKYPMTYSLMINHRLPIERKAEA